MRLVSIVLAATIGLTSVVTPLAAFAGPGVLCVQKELAFLGYDIGAPDGALGGNTKKAMNAYRKAFAKKTGSAGPPFASEEDARNWCSLIVEVNSNYDAELGKYYLEMVASQ